VAWAAAPLRLPAVAHVCRSSGENEVLSVSVVHVAARHNEASAFRRREIDLARRIKLPLIRYNRSVDAKTSDTARFGRFFWAMMDRGVYLPCSQFEAAFVSAAHTEADIDHTASAAAEALRAAK